MFDNVSQKYIYLNKNNCFRVKKPDEFNRPRISPDDREISRKKNFVSKKVIYFVLFRAWYMFLSSPDPDPCCNFITLQWKILGMKFEILVAGRLSHLIDNHPSAGNIRCDNFP